MKNTILVEANVTNICAKSQLYLFIPLMASEEMIFDFFVPRKFNNNNNNNFISRG